MYMNILNVLKALSNDRRLKILEWLKDLKKHFTSKYRKIEILRFNIGEKNGSE